MLQSLAVAVVIRYVMTFNEERQEWVRCFYETWDDVKLKMVRRPITSRKLLLAGFIVNPITGAVYCEQYKVTIRSRRYTTWKWVPEARETVRGIISYVNPPKPAHWERVDRLGGAEFEKWLHKVTGSGPVLKFALDKSKPVLIEGKEPDLPISPKKQAA